jgi:hypothetical protein
MDGPDGGAPTVSLPERIDRAVRFGPFPSARAALQFVAYAAVGATLAPFLSPWAWVPALAVGFVVSVWRPGGEPVDALAARWVLFRVHRVRGGPVTRPDVGTRGLERVARVAGGGRLAVVRTGGVPLAYRPPADLALLFDRFRDLLRGCEGPLYLRATVVPMRHGPVLPRPGAGVGPEAIALAGYRELVEALCRRRRLRRVDIVLRANSVSGAGEDRLTERSEALQADLTALGVRATCLRGCALREAVRGLGWRSGVGPE